MTKPKPLPSQTELLSVFNYDPDTGVLTWSSTRGHGVTVGDVVGFKRRTGAMLFYKSSSEPEGSNHLYSVHRVIWKMLYDEEPPEIDHIDLNPFNNAKDNLRAATSSQNKMNARVRSHNVLGIKGVTFISGKYRAVIRVDGKYTYLGRFHTAEEASDAYAQASKKLHGEYGRTR